MKEKVLKLVAGLLEMDVDAVKAEGDNQELWDSLKRAELIFALEDELDIFFEQEEIQYMNTVNRIIEIIEKK